jgi:cytochrome c oxidase subunit III
MSIPLMFRTTMDGGDHTPASGVTGWSGNRREPAAGVALWVFMAVATSLFSLFIASYVMRMEGTDWSVIAMPWQLWLSTALLIAGSASLQLASAFGHRGHWNGALVRSPFWACSSGHGRHSWRTAWSRQEIRPAASSIC